jgi:hypothetical protein
MRKSLTAATVKRSCLLGKWIWDDVCSLRFVVVGIAVLVLGVFVVAGIVVLVLGVFVVEIFDARLCRLKVVLKYLMVHCGIEGPDMWNSIFGYNLVNTF